MCRQRIVSRTCRIRPLTCKMTKYLLIPLLITLAYPFYLIYLKAPLPVPNLDYNEWWGPMELKGKLDTSIRPFNVTFDDHMISDLKMRLKNHRPFTPSYDGVGFQYGFNTKVIDSWLSYWAEEYPFKERETHINQYPQFKTNIQGLDIHFIRVKPQVTNVEIVPVLLLHGWPGSVLEFYGSIPLLTEVGKDRDFVLEVIVPSLPGFGFSDPTVRPGLGAIQMAIVLRNLMHRLGHKEFYIQGGDWGSVVCSHMATLFPKEVLGFHNNLGMAFTPTALVLHFITTLYPPLFVDPELTDRLVVTKLSSEFGYFHIQSTKSDTVGVALTDSPAGLLAYILEKSSVVTNINYRDLEDGGLSIWPFPKVQVIDNLMMYWTSNSITTATRIYAESFNKKQFAMKLNEIPTSVATWVTQAKHEIIFQAPIVLRLKYPNLVKTSPLDKGGHFLAWELPQIFTDDVFKAIRAFRRLKNVKTEL